MKIYNKSFIKVEVPHGTVRFKINQAVSSSLNTVNGLTEIIVLNITLINIQTGEQKVLSSFNLFISDKPYSTFAQFLSEYLEKVNHNGFSLPSQLVGITGEVDYFLNKKGYDDLRSWNFDVPSPIAQQQLTQHVKNNTWVQPNDYEVIDDNIGENPFNNGSYNPFESYATSINTDAPVIESAHFNSFKEVHHNDNY